MISEALLKRETKKKQKAAADFSSDGFVNGNNNSGVEGGSASKAKSESEKIQRIVKTVEEDYKRELLEL